jgi:hypothetical protein
MSGTSPDPSRCSGRRTRPMLQSGPTPLPVCSGNPVREKHMQSEVTDRAERMTEQQNRAEPMDQAAGPHRMTADERYPRSPMSTGYTHAASRPEQRDRRPRQRGLGERISAFVRNEPIALFAGTVLAGFALYRFFKVASDQSGRNVGSDENRQWPEAELVPAEISEVLIVETTADEDGRWPSAGSAIPTENGRW